MRFALIAIGGFALAAAAPAAAESWRYVADGGDSPTRAAFLVDTDSISRSIGTLRFRSMTVWESYEDGNDFNSSITERRVDCNAKSGAIVSNSYYADGELVATEEGSNEMAVFGAASLMRSVLDAVCGDADYVTDALADPELEVRIYFANY